MPIDDDHKTEKPFSQKYLLTHRQLLVVMAFGCFYGLGSFGLLDNNEGLYASIALNMRHGGDWIIPHLNGVPYIEKPPLLYWLTAISLYLFGDNEWAARLPAALSMAVLMCAMVWFLKKEATEKAGIVAGFIAATSLGFLALGRTVFYDMLLTCSTAVALMMWYRWYMHGSRRSLIGCYVWMAIGFMVKGPVAVALVVGSILVFQVIDRPGWKRFCSQFDLAGVGAFLAITVPWHVLASLHEPGFAWFYFINEQVLRFLNLREPHDYYHGPVWYYLPRIVLMLFPWSLLVPFCWQKGLFARDSSVSDKILKRFLWSWFLFPLLFFSMSQAKANYYMVVALPALMMLLAVTSQEMVCKGHNRWVFFCFPAILLLPIAVSIVQVKEQEVSQKQAALYLAKLPSNSPIAIYQEFERLSALAFYLNRPVAILDSQSSDLWYGKKSNQRPDLFPKLADWVVQNRNRGFHIVVRNKRLPQFAKSYGKIPCAVPLHIEKQFDEVSVLTP